MLNEKIKEKYKSSLPFNWVLALTYGILLAGVGALCVYSGIFALLFALILFLPLFFSLYISFFSFTKSNKQEITFGRQISFFGLYFNDAYKGTFQFWKNFLITLIINLIVGAICTPIAITVVNALYPGALDAFIKETNELIKAGYQYSKMMDIINKYYYALNPLMEIAIIPPIFLGATYFLFGISFSSLSFYFRALIKGAPGTLFDRCSHLAAKANRKSLLKDYFKELWLYLALYIIGFGVACTICIVYKFTSTNTLVISILSGTFLMSLYFPIYFIKMEEIFEKHKDEYFFQLGQAKKIGDTITVDGVSNNESKDQTTNLEEDNEENKNTD